MTRTEFPGDSAAGVRRVNASEAAAVIELFALAFAHDPTWAWAFPDAEKRLDHHRAWWALYVHSAISYGGAWMTDDGAAASLWIPPGRPELLAEDEARVEPLLRELVGSHADGVLTLLDRFDSNHPRRPPHYFLSLLGTHPDHRGKGRGMGLLAANLARIDELGMPAYLESSNRANDHRYERLGFTQIGEFEAPAGGPTIGCMWRERVGATRTGRPREEASIESPPSSTMIPKMSAPSSRRRRSAAAAPRRSRLATGQALPESSYSTVIARAAPSATLR